MINKKGAKLALAVLLCLVIIINLFTVMLSTLGLRNQLKWVPCAFLTIETGSMEPVLSPGDLIFVWETPFSKLQVGDIITFHRGTEFVTHSIVDTRGSCLITKGLQNNLEDEPVTPADYCARLVLTVPGAGFLLGVMTSPITAILCITLVLLLFYGLPALKKHFSEAASGSVKKPLRALGALALASVFAVNPYMTAAKYTARINEYASLAAGASYFSSGFLSESGRSYVVHGWEGKEYSIALNIRNYENALLFNRPGVDIIYGLRVEKLCDDGEVAASRYDVTVAPAGAATATPFDGSFSGQGTPYIISGSNAGGSSDEFSVSIDAADGNLQEGERVHFKIYAQTDPAGGFYRELSGEFTFVVSAVSQFLAPPQIQSDANSLLVSYSVKTNFSNAGGSAVKNVCIHWDPAKYYINEYEPTAFNIIWGNGGIYDADLGTIIIGLQPYSSVNLQFFKNDISVTVAEGDFTATVIEEEEEGGSSGGAGDPDQGDDPGGATDPDAGNLPEEGDPDEGGEG